MRLLHAVTRLIRRGARGLLLAVAVPVLLFEEWGWDALRKLMQQLARLSLWRQLERGLAALPPWAALAVMLVPMLALLPLKLLALWLFAAGHAVWGVALLLSAKLGGTALVAWLFHLVQPALMQLDWFARWYPRWKRWKDDLLDQVRASRPWRMARQLRHEVAALARAAWRRITGGS
jgi:hypothetical protein